MGQEADTRLSASKVGSSGRLLGLVSPSVLALRLSPSLITIPGGAGPVRERTGPFGRHDDGGRERPKGPESEGNRGRRGHSLTSLVVPYAPRLPGLLAFGALRGGAPPATRREVDRSDNDRRVAQGIQG